MDEHALMTSSTSPKACCAPVAAGPEDQEPGRESLFPLGLVVGYIAVVTVLAAWSTGEWSVHAMMSRFMAGFFIVFSFFKLLDLRGFVSAYREYDMIARWWPVWGWAYPFIEAGLGCAYLIGAWPAVVNWVTLGLMLVGAAGVLRALASGRRIRCACLGTAISLPMTKVTLFEDVAMAAMAGGMLLIHG